MVRVRQEKETQQMHVDVRYCEATTEQRVTKNLALLLLPLP